MSFLSNPWKLESTNLKFYHSTHILYILYDFLYINTIKNNSVELCWVSKLYILLHDSVKWDINVSKYNFHLARSLIKFSIPLIHLGQWRFTWKFYQIFLWDVPSHKKISSFFFFKKGPNNLLGCFWQTSW